MRAPPELRTIVLTWHPEKILDLRIPDDIQLVGEGLLSFIDAEVVPLEKANADLLRNERNLYGADGRYSPEVLQRRKQILMKSAEAGYYTALEKIVIGGAYSIRGMPQFSDMPVDDLRLIQAYILDRARAAYDAQQSANAAMSARH